MRYEKTISVEDLKKSQSNVRAGHTKEDIKTMANSIKHRGLLHPPAVALNGDGRYEIIAGQLRVAGAIAAGVDEIICHDVSELDDAARVELSLAENVDRRGMSVLETYTAFHKLFKSGRSVGEIGARFEKTEREVQQLLAIGGLPKKLIQAGEQGEVGDRTLRALAIAPTAEVRRYMKLKPKDRPRDWEIQDWLAGADGMFPAKSALFDLDEYKGGSFTDLFAEDDEVWLTDGGQFAMLQNDAINTKLADFVRKGWTCEQVEYWQGWAYNKTAKKKGGKVYYTIHEKTMAVEFHVGYARPKRAGSAPKAKDGKPAEKPATSKAFDDYCAELRHNAVCAHMVKDRRAGLVSTIVLLMKQCDNINIRYGSGRVKSEAYINSINEQDDNLDIRDAQLNMYNELNIEDGITWNVEISDIVPKLLEYPPQALERFIIAIMASSWQIEYDGKHGDELGKALGLNGVDQVTLDDAFWNGITNKKTLLAIAKEHEIAVKDTDSLKVIRQGVQDQVPESWLPDWLTF